MSARNELRDLIHRNLHQNEGFERWTFQAPVDLADALTAAGYRKPRTITTYEELDALPVESAVRSDMGVVYVKDFDVDDPSAIWWVTAGAVSEFPSIAISLPAIVLHEPEAAA
ncbi:hypothetical protein PBI_ISOLDE_46 [Arthrobacter phage Isolde]|uniref:Uncharacterized protein n=1 Tax=Arthrobacter phage Isolde TaxID=2419610 RepID=A0A3G3M3L7_9CAUD|nr:hypothetical protein PP638_gp57 [Arthrobacter phage Isolde]AYR01015.1 hypothetical protein PBI_ISOLDE_46 [Arthrobacter phage Isolde]